MLERVLLSDIEKYTVCLPNTNKQFMCPHCKLRQKFDSCAFCDFDLSYFRTVVEQRKNRGKLFANQFRRTDEEDSFTVTYIVIQFATCSEMCASPFNPSSWGEQGAATDSVCVCFAQRHTWYG